MEKFEKLYDKVIEIIDWAYEQRHISAEASTILTANIADVKEDIINEE